jgi:GNAT superfamily N-acetyltransferase
MTNRDEAIKILQFDEHPSPDDLRQLLDGVRNFSRGVTAQESPRSVACFLRADDGGVVGGAQGDLWGSSVHIAALWVAENERGKGYGTALLSEVERYAAAHGHLLAYLETTSFQARPFYESLGYRVYAELEGIAQNCTLYYLRKNLEANL